MLYHKSNSIPPKYETLLLDKFFEFMQEAHEYYERVFSQYELGKLINKYNGIANVFQSFYAKNSENQEAIGMISYQLVYFEDRWWILDVLWTTDTNGIKILEKYLKN